jgi:flagellar assembly factor FliW
MNATMEDIPVDSASQLVNSEIVFDHGLPGFPSVRRFVLESWGVADGPFSLLRSVESDTEFLVADPDVFFPDYTAEIDDETAAWLGLQDAVDASLYVIVTVGERAEQATANLLGPIVVNRASGRAIQAVLHEGFSTRQPLFTPRITP